MLEQVLVVFGLVNFPVGMNAWKRWVQHLGHARNINVRVWYAAIAGLVYGVWRERNRRIFTNQSLDAKQLACRVVCVLKRMINALNITGKTEHDCAFLKMLC